jgi:beta-galactosidase
MKNNNLFAGLLICSFFVVTAFAGETVPLHEGWRFHRGETLGAELQAFHAEEWQSVEVPHDYSISGQVDKKNFSGSGWGYFPTGIGWYRYALELKPEWNGKRIYINFDGIQDNAKVWINGQLLGTQLNGYRPYIYDLTDYLQSGKPNLIAVRCDTSPQMSSRWYAGSGIFRSVELIVKNPVHVANWGVRIHNDPVTAEKAVSHIEVTLRNTGSPLNDLIVRQEILDPAGQVLAKTESAVKGLSSGEKSFATTLAVKSPPLWSLDAPQLCMLRTTILQGEMVLDMENTSFGFRSIRMDPNEGFFINEVSTKLKGVCNHHDLGPIGARMVPAALERRLFKLKAMGCNAIRTAHNIASREFIEQCDRIGFLVIEESFDTWYHPKREQDDSSHFLETWQADLEAMIQRDFNSPSIFIWGVGNEVMLKHRDENGVLMAKDLMAECHKLDPTRPASTGDNFLFRSNEIGLAQELDVVGYNEGGASSMDYTVDHETYPDRLMYGSEVPHTWQHRGVYKSTAKIRSKNKATKELGDEGWEMGVKAEKMNLSDLLDGTRRHLRFVDMEDLAEKEVWPEESSQYHSGYDVEFLVMSARESWRHARDLPFVMGEFRWTGFDYIGEGGWPRIVNPSGVIDMCGLPKDHYYLYQSMWTKEPMVHLLPHWTHPGKEGTKIPVWAYANADEVELFLNGKSLGRQAMDPDVMRIQWMVPYQAGELKAVAYRAGKGVAVAERKTAGEPAGIFVKVDRSNLKANGLDMAHLEVSIVDDKGVEVPMADNTVLCSIQGPAELAGASGGDTHAHELLQDNQFVVFRGQGLVMIESTRVPGDILVTLSGEGLKPAIIRIQSCSEK